MIRVNNIYKMFGIFILSITIHTS